MTLSYFESILHLVENSSPEQLKPQYLDLLQEYGSHLLDTCHLINHNIQHMEDKNLIYDDLRIMNSLIRVKMAIKKCRGVYEATDQKERFSKIIYNRLDGLPEEIRDTLSEAVSTIIDERIQNRRNQ